MTQQAELIERLSQENTRLSREVLQLRQSNERLARQLSIMTSRVLEAENALDAAIDAHHEQRQEENRGQ